MKIGMCTSFRAAKNALTSILSQRVDESIEKFAKDPNASGLNVEKLHPNGWSSFRVTDNVRVIFRQDCDFVNLVHVDSHDAAYRWTERHRFRHDHNRIVIVKDNYEIQTTHIHETRRLLFAHCSPEYLISLGVPKRLVQHVQSAIFEPEQIIDTFQDADQVSDNLIDLYQGRIPRYLLASGSEREGLQRTQLWVPDILRKAVAGDFNRWAIHLHPDHRQLVDRTFKGPARVFGPAGSGKSIVALYRGACLAERYADSRILLTAHTQHVVDKLGHDLDQLLREKPTVRARMEVKTVERLALDLAAKLLQRKITLSSDEYLKKSVLMDLHENYSPEQLDLIVDQWLSVVDGWEIESRDAYVGFSRLDLTRGTSAADRIKIWESIAHAKGVLAYRSRTTLGALLRELISAMSEAKLQPFTNVIVDEAQLFRPVELKFIRCLAPPGPDDLFFSEDRDQGIRREEFKLSDVGIDIAGRSHGLHLNYRTTKQIFDFARQMLGGVGAGDTESSSLESLMSGPEPELISCKTIEEEVRVIDSKLRELVKDGYAVDEIGIIARDASILRSRAEDALRDAGYRFRQENGARPSGRHILLCTMDNAIGLEFRAVIIIGCEEPPTNLVFGSDRQALEQSQRQQRRKFYVACTRARERLIITGCGPLAKIVPQQTVRTP